MVNFIEKIAIILIVPGLLCAMILSPLYEWGEQIAARNDCKTFKCLIDKFHLFEVTTTSRYELDILLSQKKYDEYKRLTIKP